MGVRADMTPQAARIDAHTLRREGVTRLCYAGHVLHTRPQHMLTGRTPIQAGCELFGSKSEAADSEIISLLLNVLRMGGLPSVHLDLGHVGIYQALIREADVDPQTETAIFDAMRRKSVPELDTLLGDCTDQTAGARLRALARISGGRESLAQARSALKGAAVEVMDALDQLERIADMLSESYPEVVLGFDFCELRGYNYHTGMVFAVYAPGHGEALAKGGRYDAIGQDFGRARPATGFSVDIRALVALGQRRQSMNGAIWAPYSKDSGLTGVIAGLRLTETVIQAMPDDPKTGSQNRECDRQLVKQGDQWVVEPIR